MSLPCARSLARCCPWGFSSSLPHTSIPLIQRPIFKGVRRWQSSVPTSDAKISGIVDQISQLTLLETADLVSSLKSRLNIADMPMGGFAAAPAPAAAAPVEEEEVAPVKQEKTMFTLKLQSFEASAKPKIIKEIKSMLGLSLVESKKFVESAPKLMKEGIAKEEAEKIVETLKALGGVVTME
ncbi:MAG: hypothetical protein M1829_001949 [Trizodia sp. TS-e1964]|nr:MAG: hypothetical protein M1829_001949 [Trizodia sp. TS-e1964]